MTVSGSKTKIPNQMKVRFPMRMEIDSGAANTRQIVKKNNLSTVCEEAACPNLGHCWQMGTATFMIMGEICTRRCKFCNIKTAKPDNLDTTEPFRLAAAIRDMKLKHAVITSVDRDDLKDCGSKHFASCIEATIKMNPNVTIEVLIPDFKAKIKNLEHVWNQKPNIINHNIETVENLFKTICPQSNYENSLKVLRLSKEKNFITKSGLILGLGENQEEIRQTISDLAKTGIDMLTIGQYLRPGPEYIEVARYADQKEFDEHKEFALASGIKFVESGPLVRSSYHAEKSWQGLGSLLSV